MARQLIARKSEDPCHGIYITADGDAYSLRYIASSGTPGLMDAHPVTVELTFGPGKLSERAVLAVILDRLESQLVAGEASPESLQALNRLREAGFWMDNRPQQIAK